MEIAWVAGASGYTGGHIVQALVKRGVRTVAHVRPESPGGALAVERLTGWGAEVDRTAWDEGALTATLAALKPTRVFIAVGLSKLRSFRARRTLGRAYTDTFQSVDLTLALTLLQAIKAAGIRPRVVYLSATGTHALAPGQYFQTRYAIEQALIGSGLEYTICRPSLISGPDRDADRLIEYRMARVSDQALEVVSNLGLPWLRSRYRSHRGAALGEALVQASFEPAASCRILEPEGLRGGEGLC